MTARDSDDLPRRIADLDGRDAYDLLGLTPDAGPDDIATAYRREMLRAHPDRGGSEQRAQLVNCAHEVLTRHRDEYDELLGESPRATGPDVLYIEPDAEPLDDPVAAGPGRRRWGYGLVALGAVAVLGIAAVALDRPDEAPATPAAWTTSEVGSPAGPALPGPATASTAATAGAAGAAPGATTPVTAPPPLPSTALPSAPAPSTVSSGSGSPVVASAVAPAPVVPAPAVAPTAVVAVASAPAEGGGHRCEVRGDGSLWCAGGNAHGQLGIGSTVDADAPTRVGAGDDGVRWTVVSVGGHASCGLRADGTLWCWGDNAHGQLGDGTNSARDTPVPVGLTGRWLALDVDTHVCAVRDDHTLWCWGAGQKGELGDAGRVDRASPVRLGAETVWAAVTVGPGWTCAVRQDGSRQCWGAEATPTYP